MTVKVPTFLNGCEKSTLFKQRARAETAGDKIFKSVGGDSLYYHKANGGMRELNVQNLNKIILDLRETEKYSHDETLRSLQKQSSNVSQLAADMQVEQGKAGEANTH